MDDDCDACKSGTRSSRTISMVARSLKVRNRASRWQRFFFLWLLLDSSISSANSSIDNVLLPRRSGIFSLTAEFRACEAQCMEASLSKPGNKEVPLSILLSSSAIVAACGCFVLEKSNPESSVGRSSLELTKCGIDVMLNLDTESLLLFVVLRSDE